VPTLEATFAVKLAEGKEAKPLEQGHDPSGDPNRHRDGLYVHGTYTGIDRSSVPVGLDGVVARVWRKVKVPGHVDEVLEAARTL
jgi:hypothetical protein